MDFREDHIIVQFQFGEIFKPGEGMEQTNTTMIYYFLIQFLKNVSNMISFGAVIDLGEMGISESSNNQSTEFGL